MIGARRGILLIIAASAIVAFVAGLARLGLDVPVFASRAGGHGPLLVAGVFASVIALERAVALDRGWAYTAPALGALGALAQVAGLDALAPLLACGAATGLVFVNIAVVRRQAVDFTWLMLLGACTLLVGSTAWARGQPVFLVVPTWLGFFVLTIVAERLELSRLAPTPRWAKRLLIALCVALAIASLTALWSPGPSIRVFGAAMAILGAWQIRFDLARRTLRLPGLPRFAAIGVLSGALWLGVSGVGFAVLGLPAAGPVYDTLLHGVFVGFVLSMVIAHALIILPAVARVDVPFHAGLYVPLALLHAALVARVAGDLSGTPWLRTSGGAGNVLALALFAFAVIAARARRR